MHGQSVLLHVSFSAVRLLCSCRNGSGEQEEEAAFPFDEPRWKRVPAAEQVAPFTHPADFSLSKP